MEEDRVEQAVEMDSASDDQNEGSSEEGYEDVERFQWEQASLIMAMSMWGRSRQQSCDQRLAEKLIEEQERQRARDAAAMQDSDYSSTVKSESWFRRDSPFGVVSNVLHGSNGKQWSGAHNLLRMRELAGTGFSRAHKVHITENILPNHNASLLGDYSSSVFCVKFGKDGKVLVCASQNSQLHFYDTSTWINYKTVEARDVGWAVIDVDYSPDQRFVIYSSWSDLVHLVNVQGDYELHEALDFSPDYHACMFGIRFDPSSKAILAGMNRGTVVLYDVEHKQKLISKQAHSDDVNTVCFVDDNPHVFVTGSDDSMIHVWDARAMDSRPKVIAGHALGLTCVESKGDGRYLLSNGKDNSMKLWDLRNCSETETGASRSDPSWLRWSRISSLHTGSRHPSDSSLMTFANHTVHRTLVRCSFSPLETTGQRYVYSGSGDGSVYIYDSLNGQLVASPLQGHRAVVRQAAWHPYLPTLVSSSWDGKCVKWEYLRQEEEASTRAGPEVACEE